MLKKEFIAFLFGILLLAIGASAKSIIDVAVLKAETATNKELLIMVVRDVKDIKAYLLKQARER